MRDCAEDSAESLRDARCEQMASARVERGLVGCEAKGNQLVQLKAEAEAPEKLEPEPLEYFGELLILCLQEC